MKIMVDLLQKKILQAFNNTYLKKLMTATWSLI